MTRLSIVLFVATVAACASKTLEPNGDYILQGDIAGGAPFHFDYLPQDGVGGDFLFDGKVVLQRESGSYYPLGENLMSGFAFGDWSVSPGMHTVTFERTDGITLEAPLDFVAGDVSTGFVNGVLIYGAAPTLTVVAHVFDPSTLPAGQLRVHMLNDSATHETVDVAACPTCPTMPLAFGAVVEVDATTTGGGPTYFFPGEAAYTPPGPFMAPEATEYYVSAETATQGAAIMPL